MQVGKQGDFSTLGAYVEKAPARGVAWAQIGARDSKTWKHDLSRKQQASSILIASAARLVLRFAACSVPWREARVYDWRTCAVL
jgi:hypothetical protein